MLRPYVSAGDQMLVILIARQASAFAPELSLQLTDTVFLGLPGILLAKQVEF